MRFPYRRFEEMFLPLIPIRLKGKKWVEFEAFVDSGAGFSIFIYDVAEVLGLEVEKGSREFVKIGDGSFIEVFTLKLPVKLAESEFEAKVGFSRSLGVGFNIIGRRDVFDRFRVCFDDAEKFVEFTAK